MDNLEKYKVWIGPYLRDELESHQKDAFEKQLALSEELRQELKLQQDVQQTINDKGDYDHFRKSLEEAQKSFFLKHKNKLARIILLGWCFAA